MSIGIGIVFIFIFSLLLWRLLASKVLSIKAFSFILLLKISFAIFTVFYYQFDDIYYFQKDSERLTQVCLTHFESYKNIMLFDDYSLGEIRHELHYHVKPRAFFMAKVLSICNLITNSTIYLNAIILSLINYLAILFLLSTIQKFAQQYFISAALVLCALPTVVFNTSGLEKEVLVMTGIYSMIAFGIQLYHKKVTVLGFVLMLFGAFLVYKIKYYYLAVLGPLGVAFLLSHHIDNKYVKYGIAMVCVAFLMYYSKYMHPYLAPDLAFESTVDANTQLVLRSREGMYIPFHFTNYSFVEFLMNTPLALIYGLFGPFLWEFRNYAMLYVGIENMMILSITCVFLYKVMIKKIKWAYLGTMVLIYVCVLAVILAFYSPNFGTLARYKVSFSPVMMIFLLHYTLSSKISQLEKFIVK